MPPTRTDYYETNLAAVMAAWSDQLSELSERVESLEIQMRRKSIPLPPSFGEPPLAERYVS